MFSYYGSKSKIVSKYPSPTHDLIIEPFAGSARYALKYWEKDVILVEKFDKVYRVWKYLQSVSPNDILNLPDVEPSKELSKVDGFSNLSDEEKWLIGFCVNRGSNAPKNFAGKFCNWNKDKIRISNDLHKIKHWDIRFGTYSDLKSYNATWYIDPPYQKMGVLYKENSINYAELGKWCKSRNGQVIVCENEGADWLNFSFLVSLGGQRKTSKEVIWYKHNAHYFPALQDYPPAN